MKSLKFVVGSAALFLFMAVCSANETASNMTVQAVTVSQGANQKTTRILDCRNASQYKFVVVQNPDRKKDSDPVIPEDLNIVVGAEVISTVEFAEGIRG
jgi:hypothetical protein